MLAPLPLFRIPTPALVHLDSVDVLKDKAAVRQVLGYLPQEFGVYPKMSAVDMLHHLAIMKGVLNKTERTQMVDALLNQTNLWDARKKALSTTSGGMKQRFGIAQALLANPKLHHRRRADCRTRPRRAQSLSQPAELDRRECNRDSLDPHCRRCSRTLPAHGHNRRRRGVARRRSHRGSRSPP